MKITKITTRLTACILALLMVVGGFLASTSTSNAANEGKLHIHKLGSERYTEEEKKVKEDEENAKFWYKEEDGYYYEYLADAVYSIYQIGTFKQEKGTNGKVELIYTPLATLRDKDGKEIAFSEKTNPDLIDETTAQFITSKKTDGQGEILFDTGLDENGIYLVKETENPEGVTKSNNFIITVPMYDDVNEIWYTDIHAYPKNSTNDMSIEKKSDVVAGPGGSKTVNVGDEINYTIEVQVPSDIEEEHLYEQFDIVDASHPALIIDNKTIKVYVNGVQLSTPSQYLLQEQAYDQSKQKNIMQVSFYVDKKPLYELEVGDIITITYTATLNGDLLDGNSISNTATIVYKTDGGGGDIPGVDEIDTYTYALQKIREDKTLLAGAEFRITANIVTSTIGDKWEIAETASSNTTLHYLTWDGEAWGYSTNPDDAYVIDSKLENNALVVFKGLKEGFYYIEEVKAPEGYTLLLDPIKVELNKKSTQDHFEGIGYSDQVVNKGVVGGGLPNTGGNGIYLYILAGIALIGVGFIIYMKNSKEKLAK